MSIYAGGRRSKLGIRLGIRGVAKQARQKLAKTLSREMSREFQKTGISYREAVKLAKPLVDQKMATLAALHNPDLFAGGKDLISDFGDRSVNASIGAQWRKRIGGLDKLAKGIATQDLATTKINARLERCR